LTAARASHGAWSGPAGDDLDRVVRALDALASRAELARGAARAAVVEELGALDAALVAAAQAAIAPGVLRELETQAEADLAPFRDRMPQDAWRASRQAALTELLRAHAQLPTLAGLGAAHDPVGDEPSDPAVGP
jgi:hypothetical protein